MSSFSSYPLKDEGRYPQTKREDVDTVFLFQVSLHLLKLAADVETRCEFLSECDVETLKQCVWGTDFVR